MESPSTQELWQRIVRRLETEAAALPEAEVAWIRPRLAAVGRLQERLQELFLAIAGTGLCAGCRGGCCGDGRNHATLVTLLAYLDKGETPPDADFSQPCPFLGPAGCRMPAGRRPFNCITFFCEAVEQRLPAPKRDLFFELERELRGLYREFATRYAGAGLQGLLLRAATLGERPFLERIGLPAPASPRP